LKTILLAGGRGTRISRMIQDVPKCTLPIDGKPLIRITVEKMLARHFDVVVCLGYKPQLVKKALEGLKVTYYYNPFYAVTNSIGTLWFADEELKGDVVIMNADVYFDDVILDSLVSSNYPVVMAADVSRIKTGDYFFSTRGDDCIKQYGKELPLVKRTSEYVGMAKISASFIAKFRKRLNELVSGQHYDLWWENVLYSYVEDGEDIHTIDVKGAFWAEVDFFDDYERITHHIDQQKKAKK
jgi:choline kinase